MELSPKCTEKLKIWLNMETWHTIDTNDMNRFFLFVDAYEKEHGCTIDDEAILAETIAKYARIKTNTDLFDIIKERVSLMYSILDFLSATGR